MLMGRFPSSGERSPLLMPLSGFQRDRQSGKVFILVTCIDLYMNFGTKLKLFLIITVFIGVVLYTQSFSYTGYAIKINNNNIEDLDDALSHQDDLKEAYNRRLEKIPGFIRSTFGNEQINLTIDRTKKSPVNLGIKTEEGAIVEIGTLEEYTMNVWTDEETFEEILNSKNQPEAIKQAIYDQRISYEGIRPSSSMKIGFTKVMLKIGSWF